MIEPEPTLDLGGRRDDVRAELESRRFVVRDAKRLSDGSIVVVDYEDLKVFDDEGAFLRTIGRPGSGPGEFAGSLAVCIAPGDTILVSDRSNRRITVFDADGALVRTAVRPDGRVMPTGCFDDGTLLVSDRSSVLASTSGDLHPLQTAYHVASDGSLIDEIGTFPSSMTSILFFAAAPLIAQGDNLYSGDGRWPEVRVYHRDGRLWRIIRWDIPLIEVTTELIEARLEATAPSSQSEAQRRARLERTLAQPQPETLPVYSTFQVDAAGRLWVQDSEYTPEAIQLWAGRGDQSAPEVEPLQRGWTVFDSDGRLLGRVERPSIPDGGFISMPSIGRDEALVWWMDDVGFAHLSYHALRRPG